MTTILWILNDGKKLSIGDETKLESFDEEPEAEDSAMTRK
jgi:hypothetical protein